jgi:hypothetical protein
MFDKERRLERTKKKKWTQVVEVLYKRWATRIQDGGMVVLIFWHGSIRKKNEGSCPLFFSSCRAESYD